MNNNEFASYQYTPVPNASQNPEIVAIQEEISTLREEYATTLDHPGNAHEYLGIVEDLQVMLQELQVRFDQLKANHPEATFIMEYHKSCALPQNATFLVYTFGLQARYKEDGTEHRLNTFIGWKIDFKPEYPEENAIVEAFMAKNGIKPYIDDFLSPSPRRCKIDNADK